MTVTAKEEFQDVGQPLRILLAEDNAVNQKVAVSILTKAGHQVTLARDGAEAVREWNDSPFDLILMDIQMPKMDGLEATRNIRESERTKGVHTPIVAVTAHVMTGDRNRCFEAGMDDYLSKPFRKHELLGVLNRAVRAGKKEVPEKIALERTAVTGVIDPVELLGRLEDDKELLCELIEIFLAEAKPELAWIGDAVRDKDALALEQHAHKLKGAVAVFGAPTVVSAALALEEMGRAADLTRAGAGLARLGRQLTELEEALSRLKQETCQGS